VKVSNSIQPVNSKVDDAQFRQQKIKEIAVQFESLLMNTMLKTMRSTVQASDLIDNEGEIRHYREMLDTEFSNALAGKSNGLGIADMIIEQYGQPPVSTVSAGKEMQSMPASKLSFKRAVSAYQKNVDNSLEQIVKKLNPALSDTLDKYSGEIYEASNSTGLRPELILAVINQESAGNPDAKSVKGASGLMQLMPETAKEVGVTNIYDPAQNITGGSRYLAKMLQRFDGNLDLALAGYNAGPGNVEKAGNKVPQYPETEKYVQQVSSTFKTLCNDIDIPPQKMRGM
jgi:soluble lytic murein transglycosylase-like protein